MSTSNITMEEMECMSDEQLIMMMDSCDEVNHLLEMMDDEIVVEDKMRVMYSNKELLYLIPETFPKLVPNKDIVYHKKESLYQVHSITTNIFFRTAASVLILLGCGLAFWNAQKIDDTNHDPYIVVSAPNVLFDIEDIVLPIEPVTSLFSKVANVAKIQPDIVIAHSQVEILPQPAIPGDIIFTEAATHWVATSGLVGDVEIYHGNKTP
ncbi:MAG: hypothetical protein ACRDDZ_07715 [Marinifilaceae bacterium]